MLYNYKALGRVIRRIRKDRRLTQEVLSGFCCIARTHLGAIEAGQNALTLDTVHKIAQALDMPLSELLRLAEEESAKNQET